MNRTFPQHRCAQTNRPWKTPWLKYSYLNHFCLFNYSMLNQGFIYFLLRTSGLEVFFSMRVDVKNIHFRLLSIQSVKPTACPLYREVMKNKKWREKKKEKIFCKACLAKFLEYSFLFSFFCERVPKFLFWILFKEIAFEGEAYLYCYHMNENIYIHHKHFNIYFCSSLWC